MEHYNEFRIKRMAGRSENSFVSQFAVVLWEQSRLSENSRIELSRKRVGAQPRWAFSGPRRPMRLACYP